MNNKTVEVVQDSKLDWLKWIIVTAIIGIGVTVNSYYAEESVLYRTIGLLILAAGAAWVAAQTKKGRDFLTLCQEARVEARKVVWPTRDETTQTTIIVVIFVVIAGLILWGLDALFSSIISSLIA